MIKETDKRILNALSCAINGRTVTWGEELVKDEWEKLYRAADSHNILPLVADAHRSDLPRPGCAGHSVFIKNDQQRLSV